MWRVQLCRRIGLAMATGLPVRETCGEVRTGGRDAFVVSVVAGGVGVHRADAGCQGEGEGEEGF